MGSSSDSGEEKSFIVVANGEQYSVWETGTPLPGEWWATEVTGTKKDCADYAGRKIREQWAQAWSLPNVSPPAG